MPALSTFKKSCTPGWHASKRGVVSDGVGKNWAYDNIENSHSHESPRIIFFIFLIFVLFENYSLNFIPYHFLPPLIFNFFFEKRLIKQSTDRCDENIVTTTENDDATASGGDSYSVEWQIMLDNPDVFDGYCIEGPPPTPEFVGFRPPVNLYGTRGVVYEPAKYNPLDAAKRRELLLAAVGEMLRYDDAAHQSYVRRLFGRAGAFERDHPVQLFFCGFR